MSRKSYKSSHSSATLHFRMRRPDRLVAIPPLRYEQQLTVIGDLHGSLSDLAAVLALITGGEPKEDNILLFNVNLAARGDKTGSKSSISCVLLLGLFQFCVHQQGEP